MSLPDELPLPADVMPLAACFDHRDLHLGHLVPEGHTLDSAVYAGLLDESQVEEAVGTMRRLADQTVEDTVSSLIARAYRKATRNPPSAKWLAGLELRYGLHGDPGTLEDAGQVVGVTRERVRQVTARLDRLIAGSWVPALVPALEAVVEHSPVPEPVGALLAPMGLTRETMTGKGLLRIVEMLGDPITHLVGTDLERRDGWLVDVRERQVTAAVRMADRHTSKYGMTTVEDLRQDLSTAHRAAGARDVEVVLRADPRVRWAGDWLWVDKPLTSAHHNSMVNIFRQILSVISPQTVSSLHEGLRRNQKFRRRDVVPPAAAVAAFLEQCPLFRVNGDLVEPVEPLDYHEVHGPVAAAMIDVLMASTHKVMDRASLMDAWTAAGIAPGTAGVFTTYAEWMDSPALNVWGLRGANPSPAVVAEIQADARARRESEPHKVTWAWTAHGTVAVTLDVTTSARQSGTVSLPGLGETIGTKRLALVVDGARVGELRVSADHLWTWGWGPVFAATGARVGQVLRAELDLAAETATVVVGGRAVWRS